MSTGKSIPDRLRDLAPHLKDWEDGETGEPTHDDQLCLDATSEIERLRLLIKTASEIAGMGRRQEACEMLHREVYPEYDSKEGQTDD